MKLFKLQELREEYRQVLGLLPPANCDWREPALSHSFIHQRQQQSRKIDPRIQKRVTALVMNRISNKQWINKRENITLNCFNSFKYSSLLHFTLLHKN